MVLQGPGNEIHTPHDSQKAYINQHQKVVPWRSKLNKKFSSNTDSIKQHLNKNRTTNFSQTHKHRYPHNFILNLILHLPTAAPTVISLK